MGWNWSCSSQAERERERDSEPESELVEQLVKIQPSELPSIIPRHTRRSGGSERSARNRKEKPYALYLGKVGGLLQAGQDHTQQSKRKQITSLQYRRHILCRQMSRAFSLKSHILFANLKHRRSGRIGSQHRRAKRTDKLTTAFGYKWSARKARWPWPQRLFSSARSIRTDKQRSIRVDS